MITGYDNLYDAICDRCAYTERFKAVTGTELLAKIFFADWINEMGHEHQFYSTFCNSQCRRRHILLARRSLPLKKRLYFDYITEFREKQHKRSEKIRARGWIWTTFGRKKRFSRRTYYAYDVDRKVA